MRDRPLRENATLTIETKHFSTQKYVSIIMLKFVYSVIQKKSETKTY